MWLPPKANLPALSQMFYKTRSENSLLCRPQTFRVDIHINGLRLTPRCIFALPHPNANEENGMTDKHKVEVFSAGCALCEEVIDVVRQEAGSSSQVTVQNMMDARVLSRAEKFGIRSVTAVVIDGKLASCCTGRGVDLQVLKDELGKTA